LLAKAKRGRRSYDLALKGFGAEGQGGGFLALIKAFLGYFSLAF